MNLTPAIEKACAVAAQLRASGSANEANTKALVIEPLLAALGWDPGDLDQVDREYRVYDGTALDYALRINGDPRLFVEAKGISKKLDDKAFIAQTVNYANNEGVTWCVLTNGVAYRVYKTNEPVGMEQKLLFEVDLDEAGNGASSSVGELELISRDAVESGRLDLWGERVFTDTRMRHALAQLAASPPKELIAWLEKLMGTPQVAPEKLKESLGRILGAPPAAAISVDAGKQASRVPTTPINGRGKRRQEYVLEHHTAGKPTAIVDLFDQIDAFGQGLGGDVTRRIRKFYVGYFAGSKEQSFFTAELQRQKIYLYLNLEPTHTQPWDETAMRDVREIGHYGMGDVEFVLRTPEQVEAAQKLIKQAYDRVH